MRRCGRCKRIPRQDDPLTFHQDYGREPEFSATGSIIVCATPTITRLICHPCLGLGDHVYAVGEQPPAGVSICGICRHAGYEGDACDRAIRLGKGDSDTVPPGLYACCLECLDKFRPIIHARLVRDHAAGAEYVPDKPPPLPLLHGNWLK